MASFRYSHYFFVVALLSATSAQVLAQSVNFKNTYRSPRDVEFRDGTSASCETNAFLDSRTVSSGESVTLKCERIGICYRAKDPRDRDFGPWVAVTCPRQGVKEAKIP